MLISLMGAANAKVVLGCVIGAGVDEGLMEVALLLFDAISLIPS